MSEDNKNVNNGKKEAGGDDNRMDRKFVMPIYPFAEWGSSSSKKGAGNCGTEVKFKLFMAEAGNQTVEVYFNKFEGGSPEQFCRWRDDLTQVWSGLRNRTGKQKANTASYLLGGTLRDEFDNYIRGLDESKGEEYNVSEADVLKGLQTVAINFC